MTGAYSYSLDVKGRLILPAPFAACLGSPFVLLRAPQATVLGMSTGHLEALLSAEPASLRPYFAAGAYEVGVAQVLGRSAARRFLIPALLRRHLDASPYTDLVLVGQGEVFVLGSSRWYDQWIRAGERDAVRVFVRGVAAGGRGAG